MSSRLQRRLPIIVAWAAWVAFVLLVVWRVVAQPHDLLDRKFQVATNDSFHLPYRFEARTNEPDIWLTNSVDWGYRFEVEDDTNLVSMGFRNIVPDANFMFDWHGTNLVGFVSNGWTPVVVRSNDTWAIVFKR